jgi:nitroimidazol reductase NimA-like FMN-containing flavoprotein (pyridoxamine 5'-phosphate oxidase superfamily)
MGPLDHSLIHSLLEKIHEGSLGTVEDGKPFVSSVGFIYLKQIAAEEKQGETHLLDGKIYLLLSDLARHTRHLKKNPQASLLVVEGNPNLPIHEKERVTVQGKVRLMDDPKEYEELKGQYLNAFPRSEIFFTLKDFHFYTLEPVEIYWVGGFGKAKTFK